MQVWNNNRLMAYDEFTGYAGDSHFTKFTNWDPMARIDIFTRNGALPSVADMLDTICEEAAHIAQGNDDHDAAWAAKKQQCINGD